MRIVAPGKLVVLGEYAVLDGGSAIVAAVNRGVTCTVSEGNALETPDDDTFARAALDAAEAPPRLYQFRDTVNWPHPEKPGFGGSAAAVVAGCAAALSARDASWDDLLPLALDIHHRVQGSGSGLDVRASVQGGLRRFQGEDSISLPPLALSAIFSGQAAQTGPRVDQFLAWEDREDFLDFSEELVLAFEENPTEVLWEASCLLAAMATSAGIDYATPALDRIAELAREHGGAAKPSGAGGGDIAVAWIPNPSARGAFHNACAAEGLMPVSVEVTGGVRKETHV